MKFQKRNYQAMMRLFGHHGLIVHRNVLNDCFYYCRGIGITL
jgi:hypothetical protein